MIILEKPYVSDFLIKTIKDNNLPVLKSPVTDSYNMNGEYNLLDNAGVLDYFKSGENFKIYTNSENSLSWIYNNLEFTGLTEKVDLFNDKFKFRNLIKDRYPEFFFAETTADKLESINIKNLPKPFIIKPSIGFFSIGVYKVNDNSEWNNVIGKLKREIASVESLFPGEVLNTEKFIIEECIEGEEYAFDAYYDSKGQPVILSILKHVFSSGEDVSDRVYLTSGEIINENIDRFTEFLRTIGDSVGLKNFPLHTEVRVDAAGKINPIEINPLRFGGFCTTADFTYYSMGFNPYVYFYNNVHPQWNKILSGKEGKIYSLIVLNNSTGKPGEDVKYFDYDKLLKNFERPLELRKMDYKSYPVFGFLFTETGADNYLEIENILKSDLTEYCKF